MKLQVERATTTTRNSRRQRPRILQMVTKADLGGAQVHVLDLLRGFQDDFEMVLATGEEGYCTEQARSLGIECHILPALVQRIDPISDLKALAQSVRLIRKIRPDLVHCHTTKAGLIGRLAAGVARVPAVFTAHTWCFSEGTSLAWRALGRPAETLGALFSKKIIAVSEANRTAAIAKKIAPTDKFITVHNGGADTAHRAKPGSGNPPRIMMVARFAAQKNQTLLVEAAAKLKRPLVLTFIGDGPLRAQAEQAAAACPAHIKVEFLGQRQDIPELLAQADLFVLSTNWEGFPISILEAMRAGLPVISTDVNGVREAVDDGQTGLLVSPRDGDGLLTALEKLAFNPALLERMGHRGRARFEEFFSLDAMLKKTVSVYEFAMGRRLVESAVSGPALVESVK
jgi:glycosyltransferase involved in cell wall biosynthesis